MQDVGNPAIAGSATFDQGVFSITAAGKDIWGQSDEFNFIYQQVTGDVEIVARVDSVSMAHAWSKSGVMIRSSLAANAAHGYALVSAAKGVAFQRRTQDAGGSANTSASNATPPQWVRLVRLGTQVTASSSANGTTWTTIGSATIALGATAYVGIATTSHNAAAATTAAVSQVAVTPLALPSPQQAVDIGAPAIRGATSYRQGVYSIHAGGADIWGTSDQFHFVYQPMSGDVEVIARVQSVTFADKWSKTGVMIRETLAANSRHAFATLSAGQGYAFQRRIDPGGLSTNTSGTAGAPPGWVRLVRTGSQIEAFQSTNGTTWTSIGSDAIPMASTVYVGIATTSHNTTVATDAVLDSVSIAAAAPVPNQPPQVALTAPANGTTIAAGSNLTVSAAASDSDGTVSQVDFYAGTTLIGSDAASPYSVTWTGVPAGTYSLTAVARDNDAATTTSSPVTVQANAPSNQPPTATLTAPANGATYTAPATVSLAATASDADGTVARVEFYAGTTLVATDTTSPYSFSWTNVAAGSYGVRAVAYDNAGASATSATATITVSAATSSGLVAAYAFNEGTGTVVSNTSGTAPAGTITGGTWTAGKYGQAISLAGNGEVNFGDVDLPASFTVMGWMQPRSIYTTGCGSFVMKTLDYGIEICGGQLFANVGSNSLWTTRLSQTLTSADVNVWKHVALTFDGTSARLYVGGALITSAAATHGTNNNPLLVGHWMPSGEYWDGLVDEVRLYSKALTQAEIQTDMNTPIGGGTGNQSPTVTLTAPPSGSVFTAPASVSLSATASDPDGTIARVEFYAGTTLLATDTSAPYSFTWSAVAAGSYSLRAVAYDNGGASATSATSTITVNPAANQPPAVSLTSPANGSSFTAPATITLSATATDADGTIARVEFYSGTTLLATDTTAPYSFSWSNVAAGSYSLRATAYDNGGASATTAVSAVTVTTTTTSPPTGIVFQASTDHATLVTRYELRIYANGANPQTATPIATSDLGKPTPAANGDITVDRATFFSSLAAGTYVSAVSAIGTGGTSTSAGVTFTR